MNEILLIKRNIENKGWSIVNVDNIINLKKFEANFLNLIKKNIHIKKKYSTINTIEDLRLIANRLNDSDFNLIRNLYVDDLSKKFIELFDKKIKKIFGKEIFIQRYPTIRFHIGFKKSTMLEAHIESMSGHSPYTYNIWMPLHEVIDNSGIWLINHKRSIEICEKERLNKNSKREQIIKNSKYKKFINLNFGEALIFNTFVFHGSDPHKKNKARISIDLRFQNSKKPFLNKSIEYFSHLSI